MTIFIQRDIAVAHSGLRLAENRLLTNRYNGRLPPTHPLNSVTGSLDNKLVVLGVLVPNHTPIEGINRAYPPLD
jgi:hypothetical protein